MRGKSQLGLLSGTTTLMLVERPDWLLPMIMRSASSSEATSLPRLSLAESLMLDSPDICSTLACNF